MGSFHLVDGWTSSYPETTGYIIPTLIAYGTEESVKAALKAANWLIQIQKPSGGWQSMRIDDNRAEVVFNTGQVVRGMVAAYKHSNEEKFIAAASKACDWLVSIQDEDGKWSKHVFMGVARVYDSYVSAPLLQMWQITNNTIYKQAAEKNLNWITKTQQTENGWFMNCDNTTRHNNKPILHTIAYTIDGLLESGLLVNNGQFVEAGKKAADALLNKMEEVIASGRWDSNWTGSEHFICTGGAQLALCWMKLFEITGEKKYLEAATKMNAQLCLIQDGTAGNAKGALQGSFPLWGRYEKFAYPNWATKYLADSLMLEQKLIGNA